MSIRSRLSVHQAAVAVCAVLLTCGLLAAQAPAPAAGAGAEAALKYAPDGVVGVIHVEVRSLVKDMLAGIVKGMEPNALPESLVQTANQTADKIESLDVFLLAGGEGPPMPVVVLHGKLSAADVNDALKAVPDLPPGLALKKGENGRYSFGGEDVPVLAVFGGEANDVPAGVVVGGIAPMLTKEFLAGLGKGKNEAIRALLKGVDTAAPIWGAVLMDKIVPDGDAPKTIAGGVFLLGGGRTKVVFDFKDANSAAKFAKDFQNPKEAGQFVTPYVDVKTEGAVVTVAGKTTDSLVPAIVSGLARARAMAKRAVSMSNLSSIGKAIAIYSASNKDQAPADFKALILDGQAPGFFYSPHSGKAVPAVKVEGGKVVGDFQPDYVYLKYPNMAAADAGCIIAYEPPELNKNEGTAVLFVDLHVQWVEMAEFQKLLKKSQDEIAKQEAEAKKSK